MNPTHPTRLSRTGLEIAQLWVTLDLGFWWYCRRWYRRCPIGWMSPILFSGAGDLNYFLFFFFFLITVFHFVLIMKFKIKKKKKGAQIGVVGVLGSRAHYLYIYWTWGPIQGREVIWGGVNIVRGVRISKWRS